VHVSPAATVFLSLLIAIVLVSGITGLVTSRVRRSPGTSRRAAVQDDVTFVVSARGWQSRMFLGLGILLVVVGCVLLLVAVFLNGDGSSGGAGIPGVVLALVGGFFLVMARGVARARLEVTADAVWVYRWSGAPKKIPVAEISRLLPLTSNNYGGVVVRAGRHRVFSATRIMLGYPDLIDYLRCRRPDLPIPEASRPL
jgi:hypothetical protein